MKRRRPRRRRPEQEAADLEWHRRQEVFYMEFMRVPPEVCGPGPAIRGFGCWRKENAVAIMAAVDAMPPRLRREIDEKGSDASDAAHTTLLRLLGAL